MRFGTDGIRGVAGVELTAEIAELCGNALTSIKSNPKVIVGMDTRPSGPMLFDALARGIMTGGGIVYNAGVVPTASISYLIQKHGYDYGVMISASHNPAKYNGIKVFNSKGEKLEKEEEDTISDCISNKKLNSSFNDDSIIIDCEQIEYDYLDYLEENVVGDLRGLKVLLDCANGSNYFWAPYLYKKLGAIVYTINTSCAGENINENCGALHTDILAQKVKEYDVDIAFAFDGDADRLLAVSKNGRIIDGDEIIYILANGMKCKSAVGTILTSKGIEDGLQDCGIEFYRSAVGDKYVYEKMIKTNSPIGGEQSGHIIVKKYLNTGDGLITSLLLSKTILDGGSDIEKLIPKNDYHQASRNILLDNMEALHNEKIKQALANYSYTKDEKSRVVIRPSGTEPKIRIMVENKNESQCNFVCDEIEKDIRNLIK